MADEVTRDGIQEADGTVELTVEPTPDEPSLPKHIKVRLNDPAHFSTYKTIPYHRTPEGKADTETAGIKVSYGVWKKTGAETAQVYLFDTSQGWDEAKVDAWFAARPQIPRPVSAPVAATQAVDTVTDTLLNVPATLSEVVSDDKAYNVFAVHVIQEGFGKNRRLGRDGRYYQDYFPKSFLQDLVPMLEGSAVQAIKISKDESGDLPERVKDTLKELGRHGHPNTMTNVLLDQGLIGNTVGFFRQTEFVDNAVADESGTPRAVDKAQLVFADTPAAESTRQLVKFAWNKGFKQSLGLSVNYRANASYGEIEGRPAFIFEKPTHHVSTELVPNPAAHGGIVAVLQSMSDLNEKDIQGGGIEAETPEQNPAQAVEQKHDVTATQAEVKVVEKIVEKVIIDEAATARIVELEAKLNAFAQAQQEKDAKHALEVIVTQSELDAESKAVLMQEVSNGSLPTEAQVKSAIAIAMKARQFAIAATQAAQPTATFPGMGAYGVVVGKSPSDVASIRSKLLWDVPLTQSEQEMQKAHKIDRYFGIQDEYIAMTGDENLKFNGLNMEHFRTMTGAFAQSTSMTTDTYPEFLKNVLTLRVERHWQEVDKSHLKVVKIGEPFSDTRPEDEYILGKMADISLVAEDGAYTEAVAPYKEKVTSNVVKHGNILSFTEETILNDNADLIKQTADIFTEAMNTTIAAKVWQMLCNYGTAFNNKDAGTSAAGGVLYHEDLDNTITGDAYTIDLVKDLVDLMMSQTDIAPSGETGQPLILKPYLAVCNTKYRGAVENILNGKYEITSSNVADSLSLDIPSDRVVGIHPNYLYLKPTALFLLPNPATFAGMELRYFRGQSAPTLGYEGNQQPNAGYAFSNDRMLLKLKMRFRLTLKRKKAFFALFPAG